MAQCPFCADPVGARELLPAGRNKCPICGSLIPELATNGERAASVREAPTEGEAGRSRRGRTRPSRSAVASSTDKPPPVPSHLPLRAVDLGTAAAFACGSLALLLASVPSLSFLTKPLAGVGLALGGLLGVLPTLRRKKNPALPAVLCFFCLLLLLFVGSWPNMPAIQSAGPKPCVAIPLNQAGMGASRVMQDDEWADAAENAVQIEDIRVQVTSAKIGNVMLKSKGERRLSSGNQLILRLAVSNAGIVWREAPYEPWADSAGAPSKHPPVLVDESGKRYEQKTFDAGTEVVGHWNAPTLLPARASREVLVFAVPAPDVQYLRLSLPASALGGTGVFRFQIPKTMIEGL